MDNDKINIYVEVCRDNIDLPFYARPGDAGMDVSSAVDICVEANSTVVVPTGLKIAIPTGYEIQVRPRSGLSLKTPLRISNSPGTIDSGYRNEVGIIVTNTSNDTPLYIKKGDRIAQFVAQKIQEINFCHVESVSNIGEDRGGGFGSTGIESKMIKNINVTKSISEIRTSIGQDSHAFDSYESNKPLILGNVLFEGCPPLRANSDGDVILHAITNAISGITGVNILGPIADEMCKSGIMDSKEYLYEALKYMQGYKITNLSISIECLKPKIMPILTQLKNSIASILALDVNCIGITATTGEGLTPFGQGLGIQVFCIMTVSKI